MQYLLDTSICIFFLRGELDLKDRIYQIGRENCFISEISVFELKYGAENSNNPKKSHKAVNDFLKGLSIIPIYECVDLYAKEKTRLRKQGTPMHDEFDLLIGISALKNNLTLVTDNEKDFRFLDGLIIDNWNRI
ncbi:nucleic acid-binding protein [Marivirga tractuosa]|uniref:PilT protein domain protein n=1 Tax=Marivirga tractuosa (strain ATCC 23168 / DSM 4126 / NBRC 15989 / NCIMB 1408 / VKM B-1430 / H-43) TaxID=643867 RepID=E4TQ21_MARTH|nr:PIN domain-containing protein [Marivirga tractuosa]ADR20578.1 PilT protein domain protein [Marivirga tractuosa DSM 4126]BDD14974.1 nucleic acid-binding protein [Marivirga tractuosa]